MLIDSLKFCMTNKGLMLYAYVIMPSHLHLMVSANESSGGYPRFYGILKNIPQEI